MVTRSLHRTALAGLLLACAACSGSTDKFACNDASNCPDGWYCGDKHVCVNPGAGNSAPALSVASAPATAVRAGEQVTVGVTSSRPLASIAGTAAIGATSLGNLSVLSGAAGDSAFTLGLTVPSGAPSGTLTLSVTGTDATGFASPALTATTTVYGAFAVTSLALTSTATRTISGSPVAAGNLNAPLAATAIVPAAVPVSGAGAALFTLTDSLGHARSLNGTVGVEHGTVTTFTIADSITAADADGTAQVKVTVTDLAGNVATAQAPLVIDNLAPALGGLAPSVLIADQATQLVSVSGTANKAVAAATFSASSGSSGACTCDGGACAADASSAPLVVCAVAVPAGLDAPQLISVTVTLHDPLGNVSLDTANGNKTSFQAVPLPLATSLTPSAPSITLGSAVALTPVFSNGSGVVSNDAEPSLLPVTSARDVTLTPGKTTTYKLTVTNPAGTTAAVTARVVVVPLAGALSVAYVAQSGATTNGAMTAGTTTGTLSFGLPDLTGFASAALLDRNGAPVTHASDGAQVTSAQLLAASAQILGGIALPATLSTDSVALPYSLQLTVSGGALTTKTATLQVLPQVTLNGTLKLAPSTIASGSAAPLTLTVPQIAAAQQITFKDQNGNTLQKVSGGPLTTADLQAASGGTIQVRPPPSMPTDAPVTYNFTLLASNAANSASLTTALRAGPLPLFTGALAIAPASITGGAAVQLTATLPDVTGGVTYSLTDGAGNAAQNLAGTPYATSDLQGALGGTLQLKGPVTNATQGPQSLTYTFTASNSIGGAGSTAALAVVPPPRFDLGALVVAPATITGGTAPALALTLPGNGSAAGAVVVPTLSVASSLGPATPVLKADGSAIVAGDLGKTITVNAPATAATDTKTFTYSLTIANTASTPATATTAGTLTVVPPPAFGTGTLAASPASITGGTTPPISLALPAMSGAATATLTEDSTGVQLPVLRFADGQPATATDIIGAAAGALQLQAPTTAASDNRNVTYQLTISNAAVPPASASATALLPVLQVPQIGAGFTVAPASITAGAETQIALSLPSFTGGATVSIKDQTGAAIADPSGATYASAALLGRQNQTVLVKPPAAAGSYTYTCTLTNGAAAGQQRSAIATAPLSVLAAPAVAATFTTSPTGITGGTSPSIALNLPALTNAAAATLTEDSTGTPQPVLLTTPGTPAATSTQILAAAGGTLQVTAPATAGTDNKVVTYTLTVGNAAATPTTRTSAAQLTIFPVPTLQGSMSVAPAIVTAGGEPQVLIGLPGLNGGPGAPSATLTDTASGSPLPDPGGVALSSGAILLASGGQIAVRPPGAPGTYSATLTLTNGAPAGQRGSATQVSPALTVLAAPAVPPTFAISPAAITGGSVSAAISLSIPAFTGAVRATLTDGSGNPARDGGGNAISSGTLLLAAGTSLAVQAPATVATDDKVLTYTLTLFNGATTPATATSLGHLSVVPPPTLSGSLTFAPAVLTLGVDPQLTLSLPFFSAGTGGAAQILDDGNLAVVDPLGSAIGPSQILLAQGGPLNIKPPSAATHYTLTVSNAAGSQLVARTAQAVGLVAPAAVNSLTFTATPTGVSGGSSGNISLALPGVSASTVGVTLTEDSSGAPRTVLVAGTGNPIVLGSDLPRGGGAVSVLPPSTSTSDSKIVHYVFTAFNGATSPNSAASTGQLTIFPKPVLTGSLTAAPSILTIGVETQLTLTLPAIAAGAGTPTATLVDGSASPVQSAGGTAYGSTQILGATSGLIIKAPTANTAYTLTVTNGAPAGQLSTAITSGSVTLLPRPSVGATAFTTSPASITGGSGASVTLNLPTLGNTANATLTEDSTGSALPVKRASDGNNATYSDISLAAGGTLAVKAPSSVPTDNKPVHYVLTAFNGASTPASAISTGTLQVVAAPAVSSLAISPGAINGGQTTVVKLLIGALSNTASATLTEDSTGTALPAKRSSDGADVALSDIQAANNGTLQLKPPTTVASDNKTVHYVLTLGNSVAPPGTATATATLSVVAQPVIGAPISVTPAGITTGVDTQVAINLPSLTGAATASLVDGSSNPVVNPVGNVAYTSAEILAAHNSALPVKLPTATTTYTLTLTNSLGSPLGATATSSATLGVYAFPQLFGTLSATPAGITGGSTANLTLNLPVVSAAGVTATLTENSSGTFKTVHLASNGAVPGPADLINPASHTVIVQPPTSLTSDSKSVTYSLTVFNGATNAQSVSTTCALTVFPVPLLQGQPFAVAPAGVTAGVETQLTLTISTLNGGPGASVAITDNLGNPVVDPAGAAISAATIVSKQGSTLAIKPPATAGSYTYTLKLTNGAPSGASASTQALAPMTVWARPTIATTTFAATPAGVSGGTSTPIVLSIPSFTNAASASLTDDSGGSPQPARRNSDNGLVTLTDLGLASGGTLTLKPPTTSGLSDSKPVNYVLTLANGATAAYAVTSSAQITVYPAPVIGGSLGGTPAVISASALTVFTLNLPTLAGGPGVPTASVVDSSAVNIVNPISGVAYTSSDILAASGSSLPVKAPNAPGTYSYTLSLSNGASPGEQLTTSVAPVSVTVVPRPTAASTFGTAPSVITGGSTANLTINLPAFSNATNMTFTEDSAGTAAVKRASDGNPVAFADLTSGGTIAVKAPTSTTSTTATVHYALTFQNSATTPATATSVAQLGVTPALLVSPSALSFPGGASVPGGTAQVQVQLPALTQGVVGSIGLSAFDGTTTTTYTQKLAPCASSPCALAATDLGTAVTLALPATALNASRSFTFTLSLTNAAASPLLPAPTGTLNVVPAPQLASATFSVSPTLVTGGYAALPLTMALPGLAYASPAVSTVNFQVSHGGAPTNVKKADGTAVAPADLGTTITVNAPAGTVTTDAVDFTYTLTTTSAATTSTATGVFSVGGRFGNGPALNTASSGAIGIPLGNGKALVVSASDVQLFDPAGNSGAGSFARAGGTSSVFNGAGNWNTLAPVLLGNGKVLFSRFGAAGSLLYDPVADSVASIGARINNVFSSSAIELGDGRALIVGGTSGSDGTSASATVELYDPLPGTFSNLTAMSTARKLPAVGLLPSGKVIVVGGQSSANTGLSTSDLYDPTVAGGADTFRNAGVASTHLFPEATRLPNGLLLVDDQMYSESANSFFGTTQNGAAFNWNVRHSPRLLRTGQVLYVGDGAKAWLFDPGSGTFFNTGSSAIAAYSGSATALLPGGQVLVAGGSNAGAAATATALYTPSGNGGAGSFGSSFANATGRFGYTLTPCLNQVVLAGGGGSQGGTSYSISLSALNVNSTTGAVTRFGSSAALLPTGKIILAGGSGAAVAQLEDCSSNTFTNAPGDLAVQRSNMASALLSNGKFLVAGGLDLTSKVRADADVFDSATGTFSSASPLNVARYSASAVALPNGKTLVVGGIGSASLGSAELFDPATGHFTLTGSLSVAQGSPLAILLPGGKVLVVGAGSTDAELFDPQGNAGAGSFSFTGALPVALSAVSGALLPNGKALVVGSSGASYLYDPATGTFGGAVVTPNVSSHQIVYLPLNGKLLLFDGSGGNLYLFDPSGR